MQSSKELSNVNFVVGGADRGGLRLPLSFCLGRDESAGSTLGLELVDVTLLRRTSDPRYLSRCCNGLE